MSINILQYTQMVELPVKINMETPLKVVTITSQDLNPVPFAFVITAIRSGVRRFIANFSRYV